MNIGERLNRKGDKKYFFYDFGRGKGNRPSTDVFVYTNPKNNIERNHNKEALRLLAIKQSQLTLEQQSTGSGFIPAHKIKGNFLDYYQEFVNLNKRKGNRHLETSLKHFKKFIGKEFISPMDITENLCKRFRQYLLDKFTGDTPANYYARFKRVTKAATKDGYYRYDPADDIKTKSNPSKKLKEVLEVEDYLALLRTPCLNEEVREAFIFCCYTGLRYVDVYGLKWEQIKGDQLITRIIQSKTGHPVNARISMLGTGTCLACN